MDDAAIPAATLIVVRDRVDGPPELLMVKRAAGMAFAGGAMVFPGGRIDVADHALGEGSSDDGPARVAAIRETLEETAIPVGLGPLLPSNTALQMQQALLAGRSFQYLLQESRIELDLAVLAPFARWVPRFHAVRRFDTLFFLAAAPPGEWQPNVVEGECSDAFWISASEVLDRDRRGEAKLIFPTRRTLERLAQHPCFAAMLADARDHPTEPVTPWVEEHDGEKFITIPDHLGYPVTRERLDGLWRG